MDWPTSIDNLTVHEKISLVQDLWDQIASSDQPIPLNDEQLDEVERRRQNMLRTGEYLTDLTETVRRIRSRDAL